LRIPYLFQLAGHRGKSVVQVRVQPEARRDYQPV